MSAKIDYTRGELTALKSQIAAQQAALGSLLTAVGQAEDLLDAREALSEEPVRKNIEAKFAALETVVNQVNGLSLSIPSKADFMTNFDAAADPA